MIFRVSLHPARCFIAGRRVHHGLVGVLLVLHDLRDARHWLSDAWRKGL